MKLELYTEPALTETEIGNQRLLNVARALRESIKPKDFTMECYINECGTPACALGHYAFRSDLQTEFKLVIITDESSQYYDIEHKNDEGYSLNFDDPEVLEHFAITDGDSWNLFSADGCGYANTALEAALYIENFVKERRKQI